jgi:hypothetical protein
MTTNTRIARCACGGVTATVEGEPEFVVLCNCTHCQRRTGSPFGVGAYFAREAVRLAGATKAFVRGVDGTDRTLTNQFCPECGGTVYWTLDLRPNHIGIAVGHFADPDFARPTRVVWTQHKHAWGRSAARHQIFPASCEVTAWRQRIGAARAAPSASDEIGSGAGRSGRCRRRGATRSGFSGVPEFGRGFDRHGGARSSRSGLFLLRSLDRSSSATA